MSNMQPTQRPPRVIFFGMQGAFSSPSLKLLLQSGVEVRAVVVPATPIPGHDAPALRRKEPPRKTRMILPMASQPSGQSIVEHAHERAIPVWEVQRLAQQETIELLALYQPDMICVACFPLLIPRAILHLPPLGCLNVHPSLLPQNRGPEPLFWTFREGRNRTGVTIHLMDERMDSGAILAQETISVPDGIRYEQLEARCAATGGQLLARAVWELFEGRAMPIPQDESKSSYHSFPTASDLVVTTKEWSARHVYNFIKGVARWNGPVELQGEPLHLLVEDVDSYSHRLERNHQGEGEDQHEHFPMPCRDGWVMIRRDACLPLEE